MKAIQAKSAAPSLVLILVFFLTFFWPVIFSHKFLVTSDAFNYLYPLRSVAWNELRHGRLPLWTPQIMSGYPLLSMAQIALGYPLTWAYLILPGYWAEQLYFLAPYLLAPIFTYLYLRTIGRTHLGSLLGGLAYGYGGFMISPLASYSGLAANATMWLPLMLAAVERSRTRRFAPAVLPATGAYAMSVLSGWGQGFAYAGLLALVYAACVSLFAANREPSLLSWARWRPLLVMLSAVVLAAGIDAFQISETMQAQRLSIRSALTYELFAMGSYSLSAAVKSFFLPLHNVFEASAYVAPLALLLAVIVVPAVIRQPRRDWRIWFWLALALVGFLLMLGHNTPVTAVLYRIPPFNFFRGAARHAFEFTLALSVLSAYGWDAAAHWLERPEGEHRRSGSLYAGLILLALALVTGILWIRDISKVPVGYMELFYYPPRFSESRYLSWKLGFALLAIIAAWLLMRARDSRLRSALLAATIAGACFFEPAIMVSRWWWPTLKPASRFTATSPVTRFLQPYPPAENRVFTHVYPMLEEYQDPPRLEPANLTMLKGLDNVAGNEPLILDRYSRALGDVYIDAVKTRPGYPSDPTLLESGSHVLDVLNTRFLIGYSQLATEPTTPVTRFGIRIDARDMNVRVDPGQTITITGAAAEADTLALVTATAWSAEAIDGTEVARVRLISSQGKVIERPLVLGVDTAEWAHDRANVRDVVRHSLATVFSSEAADPNDKEPAYRFIARLALGERQQIDHIEVKNVSPKIVLLMSQATLFDSTTGFSMPLPHYDLRKWQPLYDQQGALVLRNRNTLPRVWLVAEAEPVSAEEALQRIRGHGASFDPRRTALLEVEPGQLPLLPGGQMSPNSEARITARENNSIVIDCKADTPSVLIVSEVNYPGWITTVDGQIAEIHTADYLLRGVILPAGSHRVEMRYTAPAARRGALISLVTLFVLAGLFVHARNRRLEFNL